MVLRVSEWAMLAFILAIIVAGLFGPWVISAILLAVCAGCWGMARLSGEEER